MADNAPPASSPDQTTEKPEEDGGNIGEVVGAIALTAWILLANFFVFFSVLCSRRRRKASFNLHVCNLCLVGLLLGGLVLPLYIDFCLHGHWRHGDQLCRVWLMADMVVGVASLVGVFCAVFDVFVNLSCPGCVQGGCKYVLSAFLVLLPWAVACGLVLPLYMFGETGEGVGLFHQTNGNEGGGASDGGKVVAYQAYKGGRSGFENKNIKTSVDTDAAVGGAGSDNTAMASKGENSKQIGAGEGYCYLHLHGPHSVALELAGYAVPGLASVGLLVAASLTWCVWRHELREEAQSEQRGHKGWQVITCWLVCIATVGMWFPFAALHTLTFLVDRAWPEHWLTISVWLAYANAGVNPLLWMVSPRLRESVCSLMCCCFCCCACCCQCCREKRSAYRHRHREYIEDKEAGAAMIEFSHR
ncbi:histamine H3 receptor [Elysia marginata]|uniref:Histamine H3 receptor n=1 Tax=Elysia marginata TaxID=1093978 RepID=A0AAV4JC32_9GAST|nr:histamine H3 receptor [Elysia marginata]